MIKLNCKLNKGEGLKRKKRKIKPKHLKTTHCLLGKGSSLFGFGSFGHPVVGEEPIVLV